MMMMIASQMHQGSHLNNCRKSGCIFDTTDRNARQF